MAPSLAQVIGVFRARPTGSVTGYGCWAWGRGQGQADPSPGQTHPTGLREAGWLGWPGHTALSEVTQSPLAPSR